MGDDGDFYRLWHQGVNRFLETASEEAVSAFLASTAQSCSDSWSRGVYLRAFSGGRSIAEAVAELGRSFDDFEGTVQDGVVDILYAKCGCPLVASGKIRSPRLCECSTASLLANWEAVLGVGSVRVVPVATVLKGDERCHFRVYIRSST